MKRTIFLLLGCLLFVSCQDDEQRRQAEIARAVKKNEAIFDNISKAWHFDTSAQNATTASLVADWEQWNALLNEMSHKPKSSIGAFRSKAKVLSQRASDLNKNIPAKFNKPEIRSRIAVLSTKINSLNLFISLNNIPDQKVLQLIREINLEMNSLQAQFGEITRKSLIPKEEGEADMIRMLDTSRAIPNAPKQNLQELEPKRRFQ